MFIYGYQRQNGKDGPQQRLYDDTGSTTSCGQNNYNDTGTSICGDVLLIPVTSQYLLYKVGIATNNYLNLCEVQVFAGKWTCFCI